MAVKRATDGTVLYIKTPSRPACTVNVFLSLHEFHSNIKCNREERSGTLNYTTRVSQEKLYTV